MKKTENTGKIGDELSEYLFLIFFSKKVLTYLYGFPIITLAFRVIRNANKTTRGVAQFG